MPRKKAAVKKKAPWAKVDFIGYANMSLGRSHSEDLASRVGDLSIGGVLLDLMDKCYKTTFSYSKKSGYRVTGMGMGGSLNEGRIFSGYSGTSPENALFSLWYRLAIVLEWEAYNEVQEEFEFG